MTSTSTTTGLMNSNNTNEKKSLVESTDVNTEDEDEIKNPGSCDICGTEINLDDDDETRECDGLEHDTTLCNKCAGKEDDCKMCGDPYCGRPDICTGHSECKRRKHNVRVHGTKDSKEDYLCVWCGERVARKDAAICDSSEFECGTVTCGAFRCWQGMNLCDQCKCDKYFCDRCVKTGRNRCEAKEEDESEDEFVAVHEIQSEKHARDDDDDGPAKKRAKPDESESDSEDSGGRSLFQGNSSSSSSSGVSTEWTGPCWMCLLLERSMSGNRVYECKVCGRHSIFDKRPLRPRVQLDPALRTKTKEANRKLKPAATDESESEEEASDSEFLARMKRQEEEAKEAKEVKKNPMDDISNETWSKIACEIDRLVAEFHKSLRGHGSGYIIDHENDYYRLRSFTDGSMYTRRKKWEKFWSIFSPLRPAEKELARKAVKAVDASLLKVLCPQ